MEVLNEKVQFQKYPAYKDSGVEWLGKIPAQWEALSNKFIFELKKNQVGKRSSEFALLSLTLKGIIKRDMENPEGKFPAEFDTYQEVKKGDFVFCLFDVEETPRTVGLSPFDGMITGAYTVMQPRNAFNKSFLYYFHLNLDSKKRMRPLYKGLRNTIPKDSFFSFKTFVPPINEQTAIAGFLDEKCGKIDAAIAQKQKLIELLKERKQIIIQNAVTKGLDPSVKMKDSGVEWIGEIPEHWEVKKLKNISKITDCKHLTPNYRQQGIPVVSTGNVKPEKLTLDSARFVSEEDYLILTEGDRIPLQGDIVYSRNASVGSAAMIRSDFKFCLGQDVCLIRTKINSRFLEILLNSRVVMGQLERALQGSTFKRINIQQIKEFYLLIPSIQLANKIVEFIEAESTKIDQAIAVQQQQIEKLKEYKTSLIDAAVTGKIKATKD